MNDRPARGLVGLAIVGLTVTVSMLVGCTVQIDEPLTAESSASTISTPAPSGV